MSPGDDGGGGAAGGDVACGRYLSCLLSVTPDAYGAAVQLYGSRSACWANAQQAAGCEQACDASFAKISNQCQCDGASCTTCQIPGSGEYYHNLGGHGVEVQCGTGGSACIFEIDSVKIALADDRAATVTLSVLRGACLELPLAPMTGTLTCGSPSTVTGHATGSGTSSGLECTPTATITWSSDTTISVAAKFDCDSNGSPSGTCTLNATTFSF
jgi:hypothetical protein